MFDYLSRVSWFSKVGFHKGFDFTDNWEKHFTKIINNKSVYQEFSHILDDQYEGKESIKIAQDFILLLLVVFYFEIPFVYCAYCFNQEYAPKSRALEKEKDRFTETLQKVLDNIDKYRIFVYANQKQKDYKYNDEAHFHTEKMINNYKDSLKDVIQNLREFENKYSLEMYSKKENFLFSRELDSKTGIRNLCMRYIVLCMQIVGIYKANRKTYIFIYNFLYRVLPKEYEEEMLNLSIDDINKYIKDIDINNNEQSYKYTFCGLQEFDEHPKILKKIIKLIFGKMSYDKFIDFRKKWGY